MSYSLIPTPKMYNITVFTLVSDCTFILHHLCISVKEMTITHVIQVTFYLSGRV